MNKNDESINIESIKYRKEQRNMTVILSLMINDQSLIPD